MKFKIIASIIILLVLSSFSYACISTPSLNLKNGCEINLELRSYSYMIREGDRHISYVNESYIDMMLAENREQCDLTDEDIRIIREFFINGYSVREETIDEYKVFLSEANKENEMRPEDCKAYLAVSYRGRFTGYIPTGFLYDEEYGCAYPECVGISSMVVWNELGKTGNFAVGWIVGLFVLLLIIAMVLVFKKKR